MKRLPFILLVVLTMASAASCKKDNPSPSKDNPSASGDKPSTSGGDSSKYGIDGVTPMPDAIDLGTVVNGKKIKWATFNVGASKESEFGDYYAWGDIDTYYTSQEPLSWKAGKEAGFDWPSYRFDNSAEKDGGSFSKYTGSGALVLEAADDVAAKKLGGNWRMPTAEEWEALITVCSLESATVEGVKGIKVTGSNGLSIFLPAAARGYLTGFNSGGNDGRTGEFGYYWSSSMLSTSDGSPDNAWAYVSSTTDGTVSKGDFLRCFGLSVRPVCTE